MVAVLEGGAEGEAEVRECHGNLGRVAALGSPAEPEPLRAGPGLLEPLGAGRLRSEPLKGSPGVAGKGGGSRGGPSGIRAVIMVA